MNNQPIEIDNWCLVSSQKKYALPNSIDFRVNGFVRGHPNISDGSFITTSIIVSSDGDTVTTKSGTVYKLCKIFEEYEKLLLKFGYVLDYSNPIKMKKEDK